MNLDPAAELPQRGSPLRALVRILLAGVPLFAIYVGAQVGKAALRSHVPPSLRVGFDIALELAAAVAMLAGYRIAVRWLEHRDALEAGRRRLTGLPLGLAVGAGLFCTVELIGVLAGIGEPLGFAGVGHVVPAAVFGGLHVINPGATVTGVVAVALEAGVLLGLAYSVTRSLWLPIGIHLGWNFTEGGIFGSIVSGSGDAAGVFPMAVHGPEFLTGGIFGLEASVISIAVCLTASAVLGTFAYRRRFAA